MGLARTVSTNASGRGLPFSSISAPKRTDGAPAELSFVYFCARAQCSPPPPPSPILYACRLRRVMHPLRARVQRGGRFSDSLLRRSTSNADDTHAGAVARARTLISNNFLARSNHAQLSSELPSVCKLCDLARPSHAHCLEHIGLLPPAAVIVFD